LSETIKAFIVPPSNVDNVNIILDSNVYIVNIIRYSNY
jgi:hypothetical protein